jgi:hypothetical protein
MKRKSLLSIVSVVMVVSVLALASLASAAVASAAGQARVTVTNLGAAKMDFTLDGKSYSLDANGGQMAFDVAPGSHTYKGVIAGVPEADGKVDLKADQIFSLAAHLERTGPVFDAQGKELAQNWYSLAWIEYVQNADTRLPAQAIPSGYGSLVFENYIGANLTIDLGGDTVWYVPANGRMQFDLPAGPYRITASADVGNVEASYNAIADVTAGQYTGIGFSRDISVNARDTHESGPRDVPGTQEWEMLASRVPLP